MDVSTIEVQVKGVENPFKTISDQMTKENVHPRLESLDILLCTKTIVEHLDTLSSAWGNISVTLHLEPVSNHPNSKNLDVFASCET